MIDKEARQKTQQHDQASNLEDLEQKMASFDDSILPQLPEHERIQVHAKQRQHKMKNIGLSLGIALGLLAGVYIYNPTYQEFEIQTLKGQHQDICLSDGSCIYLNTNTKLLVSQRLRSREFELIQGEASFHVAHHTSALLKPFERPFKVWAGKVEILDIGTVFNVFKHNATDVTVAVEQGEVAVKIRDHDETTEYLHQGDAIRNVKHLLAHVKPMPIEDISAWRKDDLVFNQISIADAIEQFQRYANFEVQTTEPDLLETQISGRFKAQNHHAFMQVLDLIADVNVEKIAEDRWKIEKN